MNTLVLIWLQFTVCVGVIGLVGVRLSRYGDAALSGLSQLVTGLSAVTLAAAPYIAVGDVLGSNLFDVLILALNDIAYLPGPIYTAISPVHAISGLPACLMSGVVIVSLAYRPVSRVWHLARLAFLGLYLLNAVIAFLHGK